MNKYNTRTRCLIQGCVYQPYRLKDKNKCIFCGMKKQELGVYSDAFATKEPKDIPGFEGTLEALDKLTIRPKESKCMCNSENDSWYCKVHKCGQASTKPFEIKPLKTSILFMSDPKKGIVAADEINTIKYKINEIINYLNHL